MSVIRVDPESVRSYGRQASERFVSIRQYLDTVATEVVQVRYFGPNASQFKQRCGQIAQDLSNELLTNLAGIAGAVREATTAISAALGGDRVDIEFDGSPIVAPSVPPASDLVDIDTSALEALKPSILQQFHAVGAELESNLEALRATDWLGQAKESAVDQVTQLTAAARTKLDELATSLTGTIDTQIEAVRNADR